VSTPEVNGHSPNGSNGNSNNHAGPQAGSSTGDNAVGMPFRPVASSADSIDAGQIRPGVEITSVLPSGPQTGDVGAMATQDEPVGARSGRDDQLDSASPKPIEMIEQSLASVDATIVALRAEVLQASGWVTEAKSRRDDEEEIGWLIAHAQEFSDRAIAEANAKALAIVAEAEAKAARILADARHAVAAGTDPNGPNSQAGPNHPSQADPSRPASDAETAMLRSALEMFARTNADLINQLSILTETLDQDGKAEKPATPARKKSPSPARSSTRAKPKPVAASAPVAAESSVSESSIAKSTPPAESAPS
jgi:cell division septum initiation protein DivIVA